MIKHFASFEWKQFFRSSYWQKSIALNILLGFFALYLMVSFLIMGIAIYPVLEDKFPDKDPLTIVNGILFFWFLSDLMMRFFLQKLPVMNIKPFLILPLKRRKIVNYVLQKSALSFFNFLPLFAVIPFGIMLIINNHGITTGFVWIATMLIFTLVINYLNFIIESKSAETELSFLPIILIASVLFALNHFEIVSFASLIGSTMNAIVENPLFIIAPIVLLVAIYLVNYQILRKKLYVDESVKSKTEEASTTTMEWTRKFGSIAPFLQLDLKLITRNKRPRSSIFILAIGLLYGLFFYPQEMYADKEWLYVFVGTFVTGIFMINFGQFIPAWDSGYYKLLMSQNIKYKEYLNSKYSLMIMVSILMFVLSIPYVYFGWKILVVHFATLIYNLGINVYILLYAGSFNRKKIDLTQRAAFNYQGTGAVQWIVGFPLLFVPVLIFLLPYFTLGFEAAVATLIILGIIGVVFHQKIMTFITKKYLQSKYNMISAFDQSN
ncbi:DUF5687 family protein [Lutibacter citreus]|uniref:DUF5687 family protein n=1 Tax=Lutibacter citreus TaxID=2138210 RepID=UPI000DBE5103|nr:DUF5687 family protein [Lutibacter citreus]